MAIFQGSSRWRDKQEAAEGDGGRVRGGEQGAEEGAVYREEGGAVAMLSQSFDFATSMFLLLFYLAL